MMMSRIETVVKPGMMDGLAPYARCTTPGYSVVSVPALVSATEGRFRIFFAQEYGHSVIEAVRDVQAGLA